MRILVTGTAGFIGFHAAKALLQRGDTVVGVDNLNSYYDPALKRARLAELAPFQNFAFHQIDFADRAAIEALFRSARPERVVHLGAQAGVRYAMENPHAYADSNLMGFVNILEACRHGGIEHLVYASSSSVYGANARTPYSVEDGADHPVSLYAATKKANEAMAHSYAHLYRLPVTGLRFFTVYGPWGRPDMACWLFTQKILAGEPIHLHNNGHHARDLTYIDDIIEGVVRTLDRPAAPDPAWSPARPSPASSSAPYRLYNIGNSQPVGLLDLVATLEQALGRTAQRVLVPLQPGEVAVTCADVASLQRDVGFRPATPLAVGIARFVAWYREYHGV